MLFDGEKKFNCCLGRFINISRRVFREQSAYDDLSLGGKRDLRPEESGVRYASKKIGDSGKAEKALRIVAISLAGGLALSLMAEHQIFVRGAFSFGLRNIIDASAYAGALVFYQVGLLSWQAHKAYFDNAPASRPLFCWVNAIMLAVLPMFLDAAISTGRGGCDPITIAAGASAEKS